jgi:hypothetical protein
MGEKKEKEKEKGKEKEPEPRLNGVETTARVGGKKLG